jgi:poly(glycerol-phosphate) alpha-glucosyltransferase
MLDPWAMRRSRWKKRIAYTWYESRHIHGARVLHALNDAEFRAVRDFGLTNPVAIIPNGVDLPRERPPRHGVRSVVFLGRLHPKKGLTELLDGWSLVREDVNNSVQLVIAGWGDDEYERKLRGKIESMHLDQSVVLAGPVFGDAKSALLRDADAFILPSYSEGLPVAVLEAWSHSTPVLMTEACNLPEGFAANAALQITSDPDGIAAGIRQLLGMTEGERATMGRRGRSLVADRFQWSAVARSFADIYRWLVDGGTAPASVRN